MKVVIYTKKGCPRCLSSKVWLEQHGYPFQEISLDNPEDFKTFQSAHQGTSVPQIFIDGERVGGFSELLRLDLSSISDK